MTDNILRQSQLITTFGPGAMIDLPEYSVIVSGLNDWSYLRREKIDEPRLTLKLQRLLQVPSIQLWTPPRHEENAKHAAPVGARIFPTWFIVKDDKPSPRNSQWRRRRLIKWEFVERGKFKDDDGKKKPVVPVRFVCGCRLGHIDDLDWHKFVHQGDDKVCGRPMWLEERGTGADLSDTYAVCDCGKERSLYEASMPGTGALGRCEGKRPWIGQYAKEACTEQYRLLVRTASNAYFPQTMRVISLPEYDEGLASKVSVNFDRLKAAADLGALSNFRMIPELDAAFQNIDNEKVIEEFHRQSGDEQDDAPIKSAEFKVLNQGSTIIGKDHTNSKFHAETLSRDVWDSGEDPALGAVDKLVLVHRLREVVSLLGFTRFEAINPDKEGELDLDVARASLDETITWLPAVENRGEGVFLSFRADDIKRWLARPEVGDRGQQILTGWKAWAKERRRPEEGFPGLAYVMLHSLSHSLMTSIALECGYPASSLRERVYASDSGFGILIYTGSPDADGTLGGLVETGRNLARHLRRAIDNCQLCSNDPVCAEHAPDSQLEGRMLQGAACHGCILIAETSCEQRNDFLDRALVAPTVAVRGAAFFDPSRAGP